MAKIININKKQLLKFVKDIPIVANKENWVFTLDKDEGTLFFSPEKIPAGSELFQVTDEYAIYVDKRKNLKGVMVEYYGYNFIAHHPEFKKLSKGLFDSKKEIEVVKPSKKKSNTVNIFKALFEKTLIAEAYMGHIAS